MAGPVFLIAKQRSGTNLFRRGLASTPWFIDRDEIFHTLPHMGTYWTHRALRIAADPQLSIPHIENQEFLFRAYLDDFANDPNSFTLIDVKYNSLHNLNPMWQNHGVRPYLISFLAENRIPVIHLVRKDILATYVSAMVSNESKVYVSKSTAKKQTKTWTIDTQHLLSYIRILKLDLKRTRNWLEHSLGIRWIEIDFESLLDADGKFSRTVLAKLETFLGIPERLEPQVLTKKIIKQPYWELIDNFESEVVPALKTNQYGYLLPALFRTSAAA